MCNTSVCRLVVVAVVQWSERKTTLTAVATAWNTPAVLSSYFLLLPLFLFSPPPPLLLRKGERWAPPLLCVCVCASALRFFFLFPCAFVSILKSDLDCCSTATNSNNLSRSFPVAQRQRCHGSNSHPFHLLFLCLNVSANSSRTNPANIRSAKK
jgi:hypothetical protein